MGKIFQSLPLGLISFQTWTKLLMSGLLLPRNIGSAAPEVARIRWDKRDAGAANCEKPFGMITGFLLFAETRSPREVDFDTEEISIANFIPHDFLSDHDIFQLGNWPDCT